MVMLLILAAIEDEKERDKLENLYKKYNKDMFKVAYNILKDYQLAQDAVQEAFTKLINNFNKIGEINCNRTRAFVVIIVRNISINLYRKRKNENHMLLEDIDDILPDNNEEIDEKIINAETFKQIAAKICELRTAYSDIIALKYFYQYSDSEIAKLLDITQENVRVRLYRAKQSLTNLLSQDEELNRK